MNGLVSSYLDSNVFIIGLNVLESNSRLIIEAVKTGSFEAVVSYHVIEEAENWFRINKNRERAFKARVIIETIANRIITIEEIETLIAHNKNKVPEDDLPHFCAAKLANVDYLISTNRHFLREQKEIPTKTPKEFVRDVLKLKGIYGSDG